MLRKRAKSMTVFAVLAASLIAAGQPPEGQQRPCSDLLVSNTKFPRSSYAEVNVYLDQVESYLAIEPKTLDIQKWLSLYAKGFEYSLKDRGPVAVAQLRLRRNFHRAQALTSTQVRQDLERTRLTYFHARSPEEDDLIFAVILKSLSKPGQSPGGIERAVEYERRINLPDLPAHVPIHGWGSHRGSLEIKSSRDVLRALYLQDSLMWDESHSPLRLAPLADNKSHVHKNWLKHELETEGDPEKSPFARSMPINWHWNENHYNADFWYTDQHETGQYFDTAERTLEKMGVALRIKAWRHPDTGEVKFRSAFLKRTRPAAGHDTTWTTRDEIFQKLDPADSSGDIKILKKLLSEVIGPKANAMKLEPRTQVQNRRIGMDLLWRDFKVGFIVVDEFTRDGRPPVVQWEVELFPDWYPLYEKYQADFHALFQKWETQFQGRETRTPKYLQD